MPGLSCSFPRLPRVLWLHHFERNNRGHARPPPELRIDRHCPLRSLHLLSDQLKSKMKVEVHLSTVEPHPVVLYDEQDPIFTSSQLRPYPFRPRVPSCVAQCLPSHLVDQ